MSFSETDCAKNKCNFIKCMPKSDICASFTAQGQCENMYKFRCVWSSVTNTCINNIRLDRKP